MVQPRISLLLVVLAPAGVGCISYDDSAAVFDRTKLHTVEITVDSSHLAALETDLVTRIPCTVSYDGEVIEEAGIRQKGNSLHALTDKPSFSVKIDEFDSAASLFGLTKLLLNNARQDDSFLREHIGADMYARAGLPAARVAHALVSLNGADLGLYVVAEAVDNGFLRDRFGGDGDGNLYEGPCCGDFVDNIDHLLLDNELEEGRSRDDIIELADIIKNAPDEALAEEVDEHLDLRQLITSYALDAALGHWDGYSYRGNNYYLYNDPEEGRFVFLPHGMDRILTAPESVADPSLDDDANFDPGTAPIARLPLRIRAIPTLDAQLRGELSRIAVEVWDESAVLAAIDQAAQIIAPASAGAQTSQDVAKFNKHVDDLRSVVKLRRALLDPAIVCGDGELEGLETCDDGNAASGDGCSAWCRDESP